MNTRDSIPVSRMRWNLRISVNRTRNSRPFQPTIPVRVLTEILLVILLCIKGIHAETRELRRRLSHCGRFPVDVASAPAIDRAARLCTSLRPETAQASDRCGLYSNGSEREYAPEPCGGHYVPAPQRLSYVVQLV